MQHNSGSFCRAKASAAGQTSPAVHKCSRLEAGCQRRIHLQMKSPQRQRGCRAEGLCLLSGNAQADRSLKVAQMCCLLDPAIIGTSPAHLEDPPEYHGCRPCCFR